MITKPSFDKIKYYHQSSEYEKAPGDLSHEDLNNIV